MARRLHFDCFSGISGDMTLAALLDLGVPEEVVQRAVGSLGLEGTLVVEKVRKSGFAATKIRVETPPAHKHRHLSHILEILKKGDLSPGARSIAEAMFRKLAEAEAKSHGIAIEKVHFHEVGAVDSIFDFVGVAVALDHLGIIEATCRPIPTGVGFVDCEHGRLPVPAPAVAHLLVGFPLAVSTIETELTTPTGAAILATLVKQVCQTPQMTIEKIGLGAGTKDFKEQPNLLRIFLGNDSSTNNADVIWQLETNLDDCPGEVIGFCRSRLQEAGALDVFTLPIQMKKDRPGTLMVVLCRDSDRAQMEKILFEETRTFGIRRHQAERTILERKSVTVATRFGEVACKLGWNEGTTVFSPEYESCAAIAKRLGIPVRDVFEEALRQKTPTTP